VILYTSVLLIVTNISIFLYLILKDIMFGQMTIFDAELDDQSAIAVAFLLSIVIKR